ncbi:MAG: PadR family transcriptional regulator [Conexibacter sp.]
MLAILDVLVEDPERHHWGLSLAEEAGVHSPTIYRALARLEAARWVSSEWECGHPAEHGRPRRRLYRMTADGARAAAELLAERSASNSGSPRPIGRLQPGASRA